MPAVDSDTPYASVREAVAAVWEFVRAHGIPPNEYTALFWYRMGTLEYYEITPETPMSEHSLPYDYDASLQKGQYPELFWMGTPCKITLHDKMPAQDDDRKARLYNSKEFPITPNKWRIQGDSSALPEVKFHFFPIDSPDGDNAAPCSEKVLSDVQIYADPHGAMQAAKEWVKRFPKAFKEMAPILESVRPGPMQPYRYSELTEGFPTILHSHPFSANNEDAARYVWIGNAIRVTLDECSGEERDSKPRTLFDIKPNAWGVYGRADEAFTHGHPKITELYFHPVAEETSPANVAELPGSSLGSLPIRALQ